MLVYNYDRTTKEYVSSSEAKLSPLDKEKFNKDVYLIPKSSTTIKPIPQEGKISVFNEELNLWEYVAPVEKEKEEVKPFKNKFGTKELINLLLKKNIITQDEVEGR